MDNLLSHPGFKLIYIDEDDNMSLKTPKTDEKAREDITNPKIGYRCISHLWGTADDPDVDEQIDHVWKYHDWEDDKGVKHKGHGVDGVIWKAEVREEKRVRVMQIFRHHKGYFWMDVLCTDQEDENKPLDIMGDIYKMCVECVCLLDTICDIPGFTSEVEVLRDIAKDLDEHMGHCVELPDEKYGKRSQRHNSLNLVDGISTRTRYELYLDSLLRGEWFNRVWTWQEAVLPPKLLFCSEQDKGYMYDPYDQELLKTLFPYGRMGYNTDDGLKAVPYGTLLPGPLKSIKTITNLKTEQGDLWNSITLAADSNRRCTNEIDFVYGIIGILDITVPKRPTLGDAMMELGKELSRNGIFIGEKTIPNLTPNPGTLSSMYDEMRLIDGITIIRNANKPMPTFGSNIEVRHENHGRIRYKSKHEPDLDPKTYGHIRYRYATGTSFIYLETDRYRFLDVLETIKIGRKGCTFGSNTCGHEANEIFEIIGNRVRIVGYMVDRSYKDIDGYTYWKSMWY